ncbi:MAG: serine hydrolase [Chloroflexia bacterium]
MDATAAQALQQQIETIAQGVDGIVGAYIKDLASGIEVAYNADTPFPMASVVKVPILHELYRQTEAGSVDLGKRILFAAQHLVPGSGILQDLDFGIAPTLKDLATLMITVSDNAATDLVIEQIGLAQVETAMQTLGLTSTTIPMTIRGILYNSVGLDVANPEHTYDLYQQRSKEGYIDWHCRAYGDADNNVSTPRDLGLLLEDIERHTTLSEASCDAMLDIMLRQKYNTILPLHLPEGARVAHKTGSLRGIRNDAGIVYAPSGAYLIALCSKRLADTVAGAAALAQVSKAAWESIVGPIPPGRYGPADEERP